MILVTGASGKTGRAVIAALQTRDEAARAMVRRKDQTEGLEEADVVVADLLDPKQLKRAFKDIETVYHICPNVHPQEVEIGRQVIDAARAAGVERFILHSVLHPQIQAMPHHWNKLLVEEMLIDSGLIFAVLQPASYMQNLLGEWWRVRLRGHYQVPYSVDAKFSPVDLLDIAEAAAIVLTSTAHDGATYELAGPEIHTPRSMASELGKALGKLAMAVYIDRAEWAKRGDIEAERKQLLLSMFEYYDGHGFWGNSRVLTGLLGRDPTTLRQFANRLVQETADL